MEISTEYLIMFLVAFVSILLTSLVISARKTHKEKKRREQFNPIVVEDKGIRRYFSWRSRDPLHLIEVDHQDQQLLNFFIPLCDTLRDHSKMEPQFNHPNEIKGEIVYEISPDFRAKWRLLGGSGGAPGNQVLILISLPRRGG